MSFYFSRPTNLEKQKAMHIKQEA